MLNDNATADAIWEALPISARGNTWGDEIYFGIPVHVDEAEDANDEVEMGGLAYWPPGNAFCIFFGRTPASKGDECRAASAVNAVGKIEGDQFGLAVERGLHFIQVEGPVLVLAKRRPRTARSRLLKPICDVDGYRAEDGDQIEDR